VDPQSLRACALGCVGEIWLAGPSVAAGYWNRPEETTRTFGARIAGSDAGPYLRTGDLGFMEKGELFITGRMKDAIVVRGRNHYPQDIERTVEQCHAALRPGCGAAFAIDQDGEERLIVAHEVERRCEAVDADEVAAAVRQAIASEHELNVWKIVLLRAGTLPKTSSGKVQRFACRGAYLADALEVVAERPCRAMGLPSHVSGRVLDRPQVVQTP
jgi:acyl-CoA synthetase (AMP-forming)/AMP-acid ligase II